MRVRTPGLRWFDTEGIDFPRRCFEWSMHVQVKAIQSEKTRCAVESLFHPKHKDDKIDFRGLNEQEESSTNRG